MGETERPAMKAKRFTKEEADLMLGRQVRLVLELTDVPKGTTGRVTEADEIEPNGFDLIVEWDLPGKREFPHDWFTKEEFELYCET